MIRRYSIITLFLFCFFSSATDVQGQNQADSLWAAFNDAALPDSLRINAVHSYAQKLAFADPDSGLAVAHQYLAFTAQRKLPKNQAGAYNTIATCYLNMGNLDSALVNFQRGLTMRRISKDKKGEAGALNNIGVVYYQRGDYSRAIDYYQSSLQIKDSLGDKIGVAASYSNIGMISEDQGNTEKALSYYRKGLHIRDSLKDDRALGDSYQKLAGYYMKHFVYDSAEFYIRKSLFYARRAGDTRTVNNALSNLGHVFENTGNNDSALFYYNHARLMQHALNNEQGIAETQKDAGKFYLGLRKYQDAILFCDSSYRTSKQWGFARIQYEACNCLAKAYDATNQTQKALDFYKLATVLGDSLNSVDKAREITRKNLEYEYEVAKLSDSLRTQKNNELRDLRHAQELNELETYIWAGAGGAVLMMALAFVLFRGYRQKQKTNLELEKKNVLIEEKQKAVLDSITYAKRLQEAILPSMAAVRAHLPQSFIMYRPKDIVAGDFYWMEHLNGTTFIAAADCTGHGVPGALVSVVCSNALNRSVLEFGITDPGKILDRTRELVLETFARSEKNVYDGMDISLAAIGKEEIRWAGANNPLWFVQHNAMIEIKPDKQCIGWEDDPKPFTTHRISRNNIQRIFLFTDGYPDQFGGPHGKKFKYKQLEKLLLDTSSLDIRQQAEETEAAFDAWKHTMEQVDDVCVIGIDLR